MIIINDVRTGFFVYAILCVGLIKECIGTETCFSCDNVLNFSECVKQKKVCCQDETCYTSEGIDENGVARHSAGCMPNKTCGAFGEKYRTTTTEDPLHALFPNGILIGRRSTTSCFWCCSNSDIASQPCNFFPCSRKDHIICSFCDNEKEEDCTAGTRCFLGEVCSNWRHHKYIYNGGNVSKSTDMVYSKSCSPTHSCNNPDFPLLPDECWECCSAGECNTKACKPKSKLSEESSRSGPLCFNCDEISDPHLCDTFKRCDYGEVCQTLVKKKFGRNVYNLTCGKKDECNEGNAIPVDHILTDRCTECCESDYCNYGLCGRMKRTVGFLASLKTDQGPGNLIFENTLTNIGKAYNQSFGQFVPPLDGVYVFSWSFDISVQPFAAIIVVNGKERGRIETPPNIDKECVNFTISSFVIFKLKAGDSVYISLLQGRARKKFSIFSGWLYDESGEKSSLYIYRNWEWEYKRFDYPPNPVVYSDIIGDMFSWNDSTATPTVSNTSLVIINQQWKLESPVQLINPNHSYLYQTKQGYLGLLEIAKTRAYPFVSCQVNKKDLTGDTAICTLFMSMSLIPGLYSPSTGAFVAPIAGIYAFYLDIPSKNGTAYVVVNSTDTIYVNLNCPKCKLHGGLTSLTYFVLQLDGGDQVVIKLLSESTVYYVVLGGWLVSEL